MLQITALCLCTTFALVAQDFVKLESLDTIALSHDSEEISLMFSIKEGYHIQADQPMIDWVIPTRVEFDSKLPIGHTEFPNSYQLPWPNTDKPMMVFKDSMQLRIPIIDTIESGVYHLKAILYYQACDQVKCYFPRTLEFEILITVLGDNG